jgi:uncharacterized integral membrane protein
MKVLVALIITVLFFLVLMFCVQNLDQQVTVRLFHYESPPIPVFALALVAVLLGAAATGLVALIEGVKLRVRNLQLTRRIKKLEAEIESLRGLALGPGAPEEPSQAELEDAGAEPDPSGD